MFQTQERNDVGDSVNNPTAAIYNFQLTYSTEALLFQLRLTIFY